MEIMVEHHHCLHFLLATETEVDVHGETGHDTLTVARGSFFLAALAGRLLKSHGDFAGGTPVGNSLHRSTAPFAPYTLW